MIEMCSKEGLDPDNRLGGLILILYGIIMTGTALAILDTIAPHALTTSVTGVWFWDRCLFHAIIVMIMITALCLLLVGCHAFVIGIKAVFNKGLKHKVCKTNNAYLVYSTALDKDSFEPMVDIFLASDRIKAEDVFLAEYPNAVETLIRSELIDASVERAEGALKFDLEDELYWELWGLIGDERILKVIKDAEANSGC